MTRTVLRSIICAIAAGVVFAAQAQPASRIAPTAMPPKVAEGQGAQIIGVAKFFAKPSNEKMGVRTGGLLCSGPEDLKFTQGVANTFMSRAGDLTARELRAAGYPPPAESAFAVQSSESDVEYQIAGTLVDLEINFCGDPSEVAGSTWARIDWELYSPRERRVVYRVSHEGSASTAGGPRAPLSQLFERTLTAAVRNLLADPRFVQNATRRATAASEASAARLSILLAQTGTQKATERMPQLQSAVATVFSGVGNGSGFFVSADGHLLTNHHVVGDAKFVKIKLATGREVLGEVLRVDRRRDVALVKTEPLALAPMTVATALPQAGEEVYALGSPLGESLAGTVTRGVLSSVREIEQLRWLQSDVRILPGSSGGPLIAANGAVIGIATRGVADGIAGINLFVPIQDAMASLSLEVKVKP